MSNRRNMNINSGNNTVNLNRLIPPNYMNVDSVRPGMLGKRKRVNNRDNASNRPRKRRDMAMVAEIGRVNSNTINIRLPRRVVNELRDINKKSSMDRWEYAGKIEFQPNANGTMAKFNNPQRFTSQQRAEISAATYGLLYNSFIAYHTHPTAYTPNNLRNDPSMVVNSGNRTRSNKILVTMPSGADLEAYIGTYPGMQANIISDENGYYVVDLIESRGRQKPNAVTVNRTMEWIRARPFMRQRFREYGGYEYFETTLSEWKKIMNQGLNAYMKRLFGISIKYYGYNEDPAIVTLARAE